MTKEQPQNRKIIEVSGSDREKFLQGLTSNALPRDTEGLRYSAILSPQGKYLADFFMLNRGDCVLLDVDGDLATPLMQRLSMYKLRADVALTLSDMTVAVGHGTLPKGAYADPRDPALGWRAYGQPGLPNLWDAAGWKTTRIAHLIPEHGRELIPNDSYILELGFERLNGVDFKKGCYVGQEVTARMKHKTELRKGLARVTVSGTAAEGDLITANGREIGQLHSISEDQALAYLRFDRAQAVMQAGAAELHFAE
ncbi:CAF17-like 4Fe-4S cluster assembly/insertion protein YgfZ [Roseobacter sp. HKCCD7870]|uniref:CAF17-like 4Fe-4S cluster assembly/insertion protein YgfZ n=1 Tax=Roseobacter sp. HKCCD7870 TaxID=3120343 RepID=UPI0030ED2330